MARLNAAMTSMASFIETGSGATVSGAFPFTSAKKGSLRPA